MEDDTGISVAVLAGIIMAVLASTASNLGVNVQKYSFIKESEEVGAGRVSVETHLRVAGTCGLYALCRASASWFGSMCGCVHVCVFVPVGVFATGACVGATRASLVAGELGHAAAAALTKSLFVTLPAPRS